jgi:hypothetical protein
MASSS